MKSDIKKVETIVDKHKSYLERINDGVLDGILEGMREGVVDGLKKGVKDGLKECFLRGFINIGQDDIEDILEDIPEEIIKNSVKEGAMYIFERSTEDYLQRVCQKLVDRIQKEDIKLSKDQTRHVLGLIKRSEREVVKKMVERLPNNPLLKGITAGMQMALEECLEEKFKACRERIRKETGDIP